MTNKKFRIAITGSIGSGKSAFSAFIRNEGYTVINADEVSKEILANDRDVREKVIKRFGAESFNGNEINRKYLAEKVFSGPENVLLINSILHPRVIERIHVMMQNELKNKDKVFVEAALIYEAGMEDMFDFIILITALKDIRYKRKSDAMSSEDFNERDANQIPDEEKRKRADFIFENNGGIEELKNKCRLLLSLV